MNFVIVTGMSGAGKTTALKVFESLGYHCVDNLPTSLMASFSKVCMESESGITKVALGIDIRGGKLFDGLFIGLDDLSWLGIPYTILFLDASNEVLLNRYKETRNAHPLDGNGDLGDAIEREREKLMGVRQRSDNIIDTSFFLTRQLREQIKSIFVHNEQFDSLVVQVLSFGFKYGVPVESDLVFDVRFLPNPFYDLTLRPLTGLDKEVVEFVMEHDVSGSFLVQLNNMLEFLIPHYVKEGKNKLVLSIGCTGGRHRSVALSNALYEILKGLGHPVIINHRDITKDVQLEKIKI